MCISQKAKLSTIHPQFIIDINRKHTERFRSLSYWKEVVNRSSPQKKAYTINTVIFIYKTLLLTSDEQDGLAWETKRTTE